MTTEQTSGLGRDGGQSSEVPRWKKGIRSVLTWILVAALFGFFATLVALEFHLL